jgi:class 3 adenylate cyclase
MAQEHQTLALQLTGGRFKALAPPLMQMQVDYGAAIFNFDQCAQVPSGPVSVEVENATEQRNSLFVVQYPPDLKAVPLEFKPFLSGKKLLSTQAFRNLFRSEAIGSDEGLAVKDLTYLFTDLEGSTALYDRIGDPAAYALVQRHFDALGEMIAANRGAIVKTIGDAIHASFPDPADAVQAALEMLGALDEFNRITSEKLLLKIGLHKGQSLAVMLNDRIDYFGQAVNIAARVQHMAAGREIYLSQEVYDHPGVHDLLSDHTVTPEKGIMKGVTEKILVYKVMA